MPVEKQISESIGRNQRFQIQSAHNLGNNSPHSKINIPFLTDELHPKITITGAWITQITATEQIPKLRWTESNPYFHVMFSSMDQQCSPREHYCWEGGSTCGSGILSPVLIQCIVVFPSPRSLVSTSQMKCLFPREALNNAFKGSKGRKIRIWTEIWWAAFSQLTFLADIPQTVEDPGSKTMVWGRAEV